MSRPQKKKNQPRHTVAAWTITAVAITGAVAASVWLHLRGTQTPSRTVALPHISASKETNNASSTDANAQSLAAMIATVPQQTNAVELINMGTALLNASHTREAITCYQRALELKPEDEEIHFSLGAAYSQINQLALAEKHYREALRLYDDYAEAHNNLGNVFTRQKRYAEAIQEFQIAIKLSPEYSLAYNNWGRALAEQGNPAEALERFAEAVRLDANYVDARFNLGQTYLSVGRTNDAIAEFNQVLRIKPDFAPAARMISRLRP